MFYDQTEALITQLPSGAPLPRNANGHFLGAGGTATLDFAPSPWLLLRLEYMHRAANRAYFSGSRGITGEAGVPSPPGVTFTPDLRESDDRLVVNATLRL